MTERKTVGPMRRRANALVKAMGTLTERQQLMAEALLTVASSMDGEADGNKLSALSRELRQLTDLLRPSVEGLVHGGQTEPEEPAQAARVRKSLIDFQEAATRRRAGTVRRGAS